MDKGISIHTARTNQMEDQEAKLLSRRYRVNEK